MSKNNRRKSVVKARKKKAARKKKTTTKKSVVGGGNLGRRKRPIREVEATPLVKSAQMIPEGNWEFVKEQKMRFTKALAYKIGDCPDVPWERGLSQSHCDYLAKEMMDGNFISEDVRLVLCQCEEDGQTYRMNGQHTCYARVEYMPADWQPWVRLLTFKVESMDHLRELYARYDRGRVRTAGNVIVARTFKTEGFQGITGRSLKQLATGLRLFLWMEGDHKAHPIDEVADLMLGQYQDLVVKVDSLIGRRTKANSHISRAPVLAAMFATCEKSFKGSQEFWSAVRDGEGLTKRSPQLTLRDFLQTSALGYGRGAGRRVTLSRESMFRGCIFAWNKWRTNKEMQIIKTMEGGARPKVHR